MGDRAIPTVLPPRIDDRAAALDAAIGRRLAMQARPPPVRGLRLRLPGHGEQRCNDGAGHPALKHRDSTPNAVRHAGRLRDTNARNGDFPR
jgi:hypothetical protein